MTPAIKSALKAKINFKVHEYEHEPTADGYGLEAARKLKIAPEKIFKTLIVESDSGEMAVAIVPITQKLNLKTLAKAAGYKKVQMADPVNVKRSSGYVLGGVSPLGQKKRLTTFIDQSAKYFSSICVSAGKRGLEIELSYKDLQKMTKGVLVSLGENRKQDSTKT